jgi:NAD(P)-dependent dehydrogenase (short-subunit alcohol dehydrogenase family)
MGPAQREIEAMNPSLDGRVALVTGAGRGIGRATALALASCGAAVLVNDLGASLAGEPGDENPAEEVASAIRAAGGRALANTDSVADWPSAQRIVEAARDAFGEIDLLVNNAGLSAGGALWDLDPDLFDRVVRSHLHGTFHCLRATVPHMKARGFGRIVNLVSRAGLIGIPGTAAYAAGKGGVFGLTNAASRDLADFGITVNAVNPAATETRMVTTAIDALSAQGEVEKQRAKGLIDSLQSPERVAALITALLHDGVRDGFPNRSARFNGQIFFIEKGRVGLFHPLEIDASEAIPGDGSVADLRAALDRIEPPSMVPVYSG